MKVKAENETYTARINYDAIPSEGYKFQVEINNKHFEAIDYISVNDDSTETISKILNEFILSLNT